MQTLNRRFWLFTATVLIGCSASWRHVDSRTSPDQSHVLELLAQYSTAMRLDLLTHGTRRTIFQPRGEANIVFEELYWSADGRIAAALVCNTYEATLLVGFDIQTFHLIPQQMYKSELAAQLRKKYALAPGSDALTWACSKEGITSYANLH